jgi:hypothetical protein
VESPSDQLDDTLAEDGAFASAEELVAGLFSLAGADPAEFPSLESDERQFGDTDADDPASFRRRAQPEMRLHIGAVAATQQMDLRAQLLTRRLRVDLVNSSFARAARAAILARK